MLRLGVNIDHVATLREARYRGKSHGEPDPVQAALASERAGAHGITAHLREDRRHIQDADVWALRREIHTRLNLEMANAPALIDFALQLRPEIVCIVPEHRQEITTEGGLDAVGGEHALRTTRERMSAAGIEVSLFIAPDPDQVRAAARTGASHIELHTGSFAEHFHDPARRAHELQRLVESSELAHSLGIQVNAGHGLNYENVRAVFAVPHLVELNIGHSLISRAITTGIETAVRDMLVRMAGYVSSPNA